MKRIIGLAALSLAIISCNNAQVEKVELKTADDTAAYAYGVALAKNLQDQKFLFDANALHNGMVDFEAGTPAMSVEEATTWLNEYFQKKQKAESEAMYGANMEEGKKFLEENLNREGVKQTQTGLQYEVLQEGNGPSPSINNTVSVHYKGTLVDGTVFDSSYDRGEPAKFPVGGVIQGWVEGLQLMTVGSKYKLYIPYDLAYGERGAGNSIPPYSTLIFEVELLEILE